MGHIVITEYMEEAAIARLSAAHPTLYDPALGTAPERLRLVLAEARALIVRNRTRVDDALLAAAPRLRVLGRLGVGLYNIDLDACRNRGLEVIPAAGANADSVAEYTILSVGMLLRGAFQETAAIAAGAWPRERLSTGREMAGKTLGILGFGDIGRRVARLARAFGMRVVAHDPILPIDHSGWAETGTESVTLEALVAAADAITLHVPIEEATRGLVSAGLLAAMKPGAVLVNASRGGVVDEAALAAALRSGRLGGAVLDVFEEEPLPPGNPLAGAPNLILTPHIAGATRESNLRVSSLIAARVLVALAMD
ncbi:hydroxyacid dehydrogenase [Belnapia rosea]|uniref:(S)-sulfolactate dehydrogenase n=1 Tax=Belnapia rosea TaxID=938405 RepID=A0A1G6T1X1_9PROT|nr:hydroxyacid dehydrogenase [Belnapia rosea]SDB59546.1 (S)-sulfolactate dehydrogenase [Belnapia rosea]SDD23019.1 (S)-sulfolactate dehydrogenase [Belnapia rosea]